VCYRSQHTPIRVRGRYGICRLTPRPSNTREGATEPRDDESPGAREPKESRCLLGVQRATCLFLA
jgi:hypothetical protein